ncbi:hypothetical protein DFH06DRAFT_157019 [Mycena polygramma]|nr:hypothetical protein DFH06DRAFT_157019 [Mycena polygramma]
MALAPCLPAFPLELEREIFEICALSQLSSIPQLMLVAQRVKEWVEPPLYRIVSVEHWTAFPPKLTSEILIATIQTKPPLFFRNAVRHLNLLVHPGNLLEAEAILYACTGVDSLMLFHDSKAWTLRLDSFAPKRLQTSLPLRDLPSNPRFYSCLTHLPMLKLEVGSDAALAALPQLTHLALRHRAAYFGLDMYRRVLESCLALHVLICRVPHASRLEAHRPAFAGLAQDVRFVVWSNNFEQFLEEWYIGAQGGTDSGVVPKLLQSAGPARLIRCNMRCRHEQVCTGTDATLLVVRELLSSAQVPCSSYTRLL